MLCGRKCFNTRWAMLTFLILFRVTMKNWETYNNISYVPKKLSSVYYGVLYILDCGTWSIIGATINPYETIQKYKHTALIYNSIKINYAYLSIPHVNYSSNKTIIYRHFKNTRRKQSNIFDMSIKDAYYGLPSLYFNLDYSTKEENSNKILSFMKNIVLGGA